MIKPRIQPGAPVNNDLFRQILSYIKSCIVPGPGIQVTSQGDQVLISTTSGKPGAISRGSGVGENVQFVSVLPPISETPTVTTRKVFWMSAETAAEREAEETGTGDDQLWYTHYNQTRWYPMQKATDKSGIPVGPM